MKYHALLLAASLLAVVPVSAHGRIERIIEKTFAVRPGEVLEVETQGGSIQVNSTNEDKVVVVAKQRIKASSEEEADELLRDLTLTIEQAGDGVIAKSRYERRSWSGSLPVQVDFVVTVPLRYDVALRTSGGQVKIGDLDGRVDARTSGGSISIGKVTGDIEARTSGGNISLVEGASDVRLDTSGGSIRVERAIGKTDLHTSGGHIEIKSVENVVQASTSGGNVTATIAGPMKGDCSLSTSGGHVRAIVDRSASFHLDASTSGGGVHADGLTITIDRGGAGRSRLSGKVNGGGALLKLRTSGGGIDVETR